MTKTYDLMVIGGGPAGTSAAITAARAGWQVLLLERGRFPRHKVCGEFVSAESLELLRWLLGAERNDLLNSSLSLSETRVLLDGRCVRIPVDPPSVSIARYDLDLALWNAARQEGVTTLHETTVQTVECEQAFSVVTSRGAFRGRALINASGRWSNLSRESPTTAGSRWLGVKAHCSGEMESGVDLYFFDGGYCGVQPVPAADGSTLLNVCALFRQGVASGLQDVFACHPLLKARSASWTTAFPALSTFPVMFREPVPVSRRVCNAGDAAGFVDPFVGDGISLALRGGHLAAQNLSSFLAGRSSLEEALQSYADSYRRALRPVYRVSSWLRYGLGAPRLLRAAVLAGCEASPRLARLLVEATRPRPLQFSEAVGD